MEITHPIKRYLDFKFLGRYNPMKLTIALTFMCNSKCNICDIWQFYNKNPEKSDFELSKDDYFDLFDELKNDLIWLEFTGGEAFLRKDLVDIVSKAYETSIIAGSLTSNGLSTRVVTSKTKKILEGIPKNKSLTMGVSLDGDRNLYERIRGVDGFKKAISTFIKLKDLNDRYSNFQPHIAYTISHLNAGNFKDFYEYLNTEEDIGIHDFSFTVEHFKGFYYEGNSETKPSAYNGFRTEVGKDVKHISNLLGSTKIKLNKDAIGWTKEKFYRFYLKNIPSFLEQPMEMVIPCTASKLSAYIDPYGCVYPCTMWNNKLGNIKEMSFSDVWGSEKTKYIRRTIEQAKCPNCWTPCEAQPSFIGSFERLFWRC